MKYPYVYKGTVTATTAGAAIPTTKAMLNGGNGQSCLVYFTAATADAVTYNPPGETITDTTGNKLPASMYGPLPLPLTFGAGEDGTEQANRGYLAASSGTVAVEVMVRFALPGES